MIEQPTSTQENDESSKDKKRSPEDWATLWMSRVEQAEKENEKWRERGNKITRIYQSQAANEQSSTADTAKFNIFWSNVETLGPATYSRRPKVEVYRRFRDEDPVGRLAGQILERALQYEIDCRQDFHATVRSCVKDRLLPGLAQCWIRYEPEFKIEEQVLPDPEDPLGLPTVQEVELLSDEFTPVDYVYWEDFIVSPARTWPDVRWVARFLLFTPDALKRRFEKSIKKFKGDIDDVPCNLDPAQPPTDDQGQKPQSFEELGTRRAGVYEIWDKETKKLFWIAKGVTVPLDIQEDKYKLEDFFPCPAPLLATTTNSKILPTPDYIYYQDQIRELDQVTRRISILVGSLRLIGVYDATNTNLETLFSGGLENKMVPVNSWAAFADKGGMKGVMDWVPLDQVFKILQGLYEAREQLKQTVYEITGMADIVRGQSMASETLGAQQIKAKFANLRLSSRQQQVAEFVTGILRIKAEVMCEHYSPETLVRISSADQISEVVDDLARMTEQAQAQAQQAIQQAMGQVQPSQPGQPPQPQQPPPQAPPVEPVTDPMQSQVLQKALALLKDERIRRYRIEVASDSMVELDEVDERERRTEFMSTIANFFNGMKNVTAVGPEMVPVALEMLKFVIRGFRTGRELEARVEEAISKIEQRMKQPPQQPPDPSIQVAQIRDKGETERTGMKIKADQQLAGLEGKLDLHMAEQEQRHEMMTKAVEQQFEAGQAQQAQQAEGQAAAFQAFQQQLSEQRQAEQSAVEAAMSASTDQAGQQIEALKKEQQDVITALETAIKQAGRLKKRVPVYDGQGELIEAREEFIE